MPAWARASVRAGSARPCAAAARRTCRSGRWTRAETSCGEPFSLSTEGEQRKVEAIEVVADHEIEREACAREVLLCPVAVRPLRAAKIVCRPARTNILSVSCGDVAEQRPGGLRGGHDAAPAKLAVAVREDVLAEAAALVLD